MKKHDYFALALAAVILAMIFAIAPKVETIADEHEAMKARDTTRAGALPGARARAGAISKRSFPSP